MEVNLIQCLILKQMNNYKILRQEQILLGNQFNINQILILENCSGWKIQMVSHKGYKVLKSIDDKYQKLRITIVGILVKIFSQYTEQNSRRLERIKQIIYSASLSQITESRGITREHLLKLIASYFLELSISKQAESFIVKMFNVSPFFDLIIMQALGQLNSNFLTSDKQIESWLQGQLNLLLVWTDNMISIESENELFLIKKGRQKKDLIQDKAEAYSEEILRYSTQPNFVFESGEQNYQVFDRKTKDEIFQKLLFEQEQINHPIHEVNQSLYASVYSSEMDLGNSRIKNTPIGQLKSEGETLNLDTQKANKYKKSSNQQDIIEEQEEDEQRTIKKVRRKPDKQQSTIWKILCCKL